MPEPRRGQHRRELRLRSHERRAFARAAARTSRHRREDLKDDYGKLDSQGCIDALDAFFVCLTLTECAELMREDSTACRSQQDGLLAACPTVGDDDAAATAPADRRLHERLEFVSSSAP